jgi:hypothetical protein
MSSDSKKPQNAGYRKPPVNTRFQKGTSGNPSGRPKRPAQPLDPGSVLQSIDNEEIVVIDNGKRKRMTKAEIGFRQLFTKATRGDLTAARLIIGMVAKYFAPEAQGSTEYEFMTETEFARRFRRNWQGNPKGRPKQVVRPMSIAYLFRKVANEQVAIEVDGSNAKMTRWEAFLRQIHTLALNKDASAARLLDQIRKQFPGNAAPGGKIIYIISESDLRL